MLLTAVRRTWIGIVLLTAVGCGAQGDGAVGDRSGNPDSSAAGSRATNSQPGAGGGGSADLPPKYDNPNEDGSNSSGGGIQYVDLGPGEPVCGASSFAAEEVVVETVVQVPEEITEVITEEVPETVTEEVVETITTVKPTVLYIMFDQSMSMAGFPWGQVNLWDPAVEALQAFANDPKSAGLGVALQYFPLGGGSCSNGSGYSTPEVKVGKLPGRAAAFNKSLTDHNPNGTGTPIEGALRGVTEFCKKYQHDHPDEQCVSVLVTDGKPELAGGCNENTNTLAAIAGAAHDAGVTTFAVGLQGASFPLLDAIADKGGAPDCDSRPTRFACDVSSGASGLLNALNTIREKVVTTDTHTETHVVTHEVVHTETRTEVHTEIVEQVQRTSLPCEWAIPESSDSDPFDRNKVNIRLSNEDSQTTFVHVKGQDACVANGWYFDNEEQPTRLIACAEACEDIEAAESSKIDILLGCATIGPS